MQIREGSPNDFEKLNDFMELVDREFFPPLSQRNGGIHGRISCSLAQEDANYLIAEIDGGMAGAIGYKKYWNGTSQAYISFMAVHPQYRGMNIARSLDAALTHKLSVEGMSHINVTTWSTNTDACQMYHRLGYCVTRLIKDHRSLGVHTVYFRKTINQL